MSAAQRMKGTPVTSQSVKLSLLAAAALLALSACGSSGTTTASAGQQAGNPGFTGGQQGGQATGRGGFGGGGFAGGHFPGAVGQIAEVDGKTLQVQNQSTGQVAVTWTASTAISASVKATLADVKVGSCVTVSPVRTDSGTTAGTTPGTGSAPSSGPVAAGEVRITPATGGSCTRGGLGGGFGGPGEGFRGGRGGSFSGGAPSGAPSGAPTTRPSGAPSGGFRGRGGFGFGANGKVTAVTSDGFTVAAMTFNPSDPSAKPSTHDVTVTVSGATTYSTTQKANGSALKVGACVTAIGTANDTGAVTAKTIQVTDPVGGSCGFGFAGGGRG